MLQKTEWERSMSIDDCLRRERRSSHRLFYMKKTFDISFRLIDFRHGLHGLSGSSISLSLECFFFLSEHLGDFFKL